MSARPTLMAAVSWLFSRLVSSVVVSAAAVFKRPLPCSFGRAVTSIVTEPPFGIVPRSHSIGFATSHVPCEESAEISLTA